MGNISTTQMIIGIIVFFLAYSIFNTWQMKDKIKCTFIKQDGTEEDKYAKISQNRIDFSGRWFNLNSNRVILKLVWIGVIPTWVRCLKYKFDSNMPLDPRTWNNTYDNPADRKALNRAEAIQSLMTKQKTLLGASAGKKSFLESLMPIITIGGFIILGYVVYSIMQKQDQIGLAQNVIQEMLLKMQK